MKQYIWYQSSRFGLALMGTWVALETLGRSTAHGIRLSPQVGWDFWLGLGVVAAIILGERWWAVGHPDFFPGQPLRALNAHELSRAHEVAHRVNQASQGLLPLGVLNTVLQVLLPGETLVRLAHVTILWFGLGWAFLFLSALAWWSWLARPH
ncbi:hypothetical protein [Lacticaseibacillus daqingensis]|uniref:hypothetical protein n=1 Tax=Lacticaseibacillus daqingensis TaxID=2486014 RepID=UPI000F78B043|nr:hypothetical protein [Lacticaseibacillus daqingensis]